VRVILREAAGHPKPRGLLVVEVGNSEHALRAPSRGCPSCGWHSSAAAAGFLLTREQLTKH
jgi:hypothetical protein